MTRITCPESWTRISLISGIDVEPYDVYTDTATSDRNNTFALVTWCDRRAGVVDDLDDEVSGDEELEQVGVRCHYLVVVGPGRFSR